MNHNIKRADGAPYSALPGGMAGAQGAGIRRRGGQAGRTTGGKSRMPNAYFT